MLSLAGAMLLAAGTASAASPRSNLYSVAAVTRFCTEAQKVVSSTDLKSINIVHYARTQPGGRGTTVPDIPDYIFSSSAPYDGPNLSAYNGKEPTGPDLPLTTQQLVSVRELPNGYEIPVVISCKMKSAEGITHHFPATPAGAQNTCKQMNQQIVSQVYGSLSSFERRYLRFSQSQVIFDDDEIASSGPAWLGQIPVFIPPVLYEDQGLLHIYSPAITVPVDFEDPNVGDDKKGSYYCHFAAPEYVRAVVTGQALPFPN